MHALVDLHAKISLPGKGTREAVQHAAAAAQQGGVAAVLVHSAGSLCFDSPASLDSFHDAAACEQGVSLIPAGSLSLQGEGTQQAPYNTLAARGVGGLSDAEHAPSDILMLYRAMKYVAELGLIMSIRADVPALTKGTYMHPSSTSYSLGLHGTPACAEEIGTESLIRMAADAGCRLHIQSVSTAEAVSIIRRAKAAGQAVTAEVALQHLLFTHENVGDYDTTFKTLPPLRDASDCDALLAGVKDGTIDCIVSDHTPCTPFAKKQDFPTAPHGMLGLDTYLPALYTHLVKPGKLSWQELVAACCERPAALLGIESLPRLRFNTAATRSITAEQLPSGTLNSPFLGQTLCGELN